MPAKYVAFCSGVPLCFYVLPAFLPSLLGTLRYADLRIKLSPALKNKDQSQQLRKLPPTKELKLSVCRTVCAATRVRLGLYA